MCRQTMRHCPGLEGHILYAKIFCVFVFHHKQDNRVFCRIGESIAHCHVHRYHVANRLPGDTPCGYKATSLYHSQYSYSKVKGEGCVEQLPLTFPLIKIIKVRERLCLSRYQKLPAMGWRLAKPAGNPLSPSLVNKGHNSNKGNKKKCINV